MRGQIRVLCDHALIIRALNDYATAQVDKAAPSNLGLPSWAEHRRRAKRARQFANEYRRSMATGCRCAASSALTDSPCGRDEGDAVDVLMADNPDHGDDQGDGEW